MDTVKKMTDPKIKFQRNNKPKEITKEELNSSMNRIIQDQRVKLYVIREQKLDDNIAKLYIYIWLKCTSGL